MLHARHNEGLLLAVASHSNSGSRMQQAQPLAKPLHALLSCIISACFSHRGLPRNFFHTIDPFLRRSTHSPHTSSLLNTFHHPNLIYTIKWYGHVKRSLIYDFIYFTNTNRLSNSFISDSITFYSNRCHIIHLSVPVNLDQSLSIYQVIGTFV